MGPVGECERVFPVDHNRRMWALSRCRAVATKHLQVNHQMTMGLRFAGLTRYVVAPKYGRVAAAVCWTREAAMESGTVLEMPVIVLEG